MKIKVIKVITFYRMRFQTLNMAMDQKVLLQYHHKIPFSQMIQRKQFQTILIIFIFQLTILISLLPSIKINNKNRFLINSLFLIRFNKLIF